MFKASTLIGVIGCICNVNSGPTITEKNVIVPDTKDWFTDFASNLTWAHAVNNADFLENVLTNENIHMIEADVRMYEGIPVMKNNAWENYDLTLEDFINRIYQHNAENLNARKGVKLDFKQSEAFHESVNLELFNGINYPLWINADIVEGPGGTNPQVILLKEDLHALPTGVVYSLGWTTGRAYDKERYTAQHLAAMDQKLNELSISQKTITFPVRGISAAQDTDLLIHYVKNTPNRTLTVWSDKNDTGYFDETSTIFLKILFDEFSSKAFFDIPSDLQALMYQVI